MVLAAWIIHNNLDTQFVVIPDAAIWPGSHAASKLSLKYQEIENQGRIPEFSEL